MKEGLANLRLFFRLSVGGFFFEETFLDRTKSLPPEAVYEVLVDCKGHPGVGGDCLKVLVPQLTQWKVFSLLLGFVDKADDLNPVEARALAEVLAVMEEFRDSDLMNENVVDHKRPEIRLRLVEILAGRDSAFFFQQISELLSRKAHDDDNLNVRLAAVKGITIRPGLRMTRSLISLLGHSDKDTRAAAYKALKVRGDQDNFELKLCESLEIEVKSGDEKSDRAKNLRNLIKYGVRRWHLNTLLSIIWKGFLAHNQKLEQQCRDAIDLLLDGPNQAPNPHLIGAYRRAADYPAEKHLIFTALRNRKGDDIALCMLRIARNDPDERYWVPALGELTKHGKIDDIKKDLFQEV